MKLNGIQNLKFWVVLLGLSGLLALAWYTVGNRADAKARASLNSILAGQRQTLKPSLDNPLGFSPFSASPGRHFNKIFNDLLDEMNNMPEFHQLQGPKSSSVEITEQTDSYLVKVPISKAEDAEKIQVQVQPHQIQVSGQLTRQTNGYYTSSSFMQSFATDAELEPDKVKRSVQENELVITIPKKQAGAKQGEITLPSGNFI